MQVDRITGLLDGVDQYAADKAVQRLWRKLLALANARQMCQRLSRTLARGQ